MVDADKYPVESDRRRFVKGVVGSAAVATVAATGAAAVDTATAPAGAGGGIRQFFGIDRTDGPAPRGMPLIPVELDDDGNLVGIWPEVEEREDEGRTIQVAEMELGGLTYTSEWFHYCGKQNSAAVEPGADMDNFIRYAEASQYEWQTAEAPGGEPVNIEHFEDYEEWGNEIGQDGIGKPAHANWRSVDLGPAEQLVVQVIRSPLIEDAAAEDEWLADYTDEGFMAFLNVCTHFCCVPGYKVTQEAERFDAGDGIYCQCHQSVYDPFTIRQQQFVALPRPD